MRIYVDTSVFSHAADPEAKMLHVQSAAFFEAVKGKHEIALCNLVTDEFDDCPDSDWRDTLKKFAGSHYDFPIEVTPETAEKILLPIARDLTERGAIPPDFSQEDNIRADARHIAAALYYGMDLLVSNNFRHLSRRETNAGVVEYARQKGYRRLEILSPREVLIRERGQENEGDSPAAAAKDAAGASSRSHGPTDR